MGLNKPRLTIDVLIKGGFVRVGCWQVNQAHELMHNIALPREPGVYAFVIDDVATYVGLASRSIHQRLAFYKKPGTTQRTNMRLNGIIRGLIGSGAVVEILVAHPPDSEWNRFRISGPEGLEAALIRDFDLDWNVRGSMVDKVQGLRGDGSIHSDLDRATLGDRILDAVRRRPSLTELELAKQLFGPAAVQQRVNQHCRRLVEQRKLDRRGSGGQLDPFVYFPMG
jgi:hypothetical protein